MRFSFVNFTTDINSGRVVVYFTNFYRKPVLLYPGSECRKGQLRHWHRLSNILSLAMHRQVIWCCNCDIISRSSSPMTISSWETMTTFHEVDRLVVNLQVRIKKTKKPPPKRNLLFSTWWNTTRTKTICLYETKTKLKMFCYFCKAVAFVPLCISVRINIIRTYYSGIERPLE